MKIRSNFVSNSSSSSFIIGILKISNMDLKEIIKFSDNHNDEKDEFIIINNYYISRLYDSDSCRINFLENSKREIVVMTFLQNKSLTVDITNDSPFDTYLIYQYIPNEGDDNFMSSGYDYIDYDIKEDFFDNKRKEVMKFIRDNGGKVLFGAGRNG